ncbi:MAG: rhodanese-like domain-containing protein [Ignavibacteriales bacterium]|nr:rhodanese-like domain-containing protein [Ignavibacteriales bacterium]
MKNFFPKLSLNKKLALLAFILGLIAIFAGNPYRGSSVTLDTKELSLIVDKTVDHVSAEELADWIIQGKSDFKLLDLRTEKEFNEYHIPSAELVPLAELNQYPLLRNEKIVLYSEGGIHSAQAWMLLRANGYKAVYMLFGGLEEWADKILFPKLAQNATPEQTTAFEKMKEVSKFFGGSPQVGGATEEVSSKKPMPKLEMPTGGSAPTAGKKKKKEGC